MKLPRFLCLLAAPAVIAGAAEPTPAVTQLDPLVITAARSGQPAEQVAFSVKSLDAGSLRASPALTLDGALRSVPGFTLFRRSDSFTANPTAQGVSLRGLGPSGASRSLIVLDGVPLNDPFGGWVAWTKVPRDGLARAELVPGGGATAWGNAALGGVVQLITEPVTGAATQASLSTGDYTTRSFEMATTQPTTTGGSVQLLGRMFATNGFRLVGRERRGPIDIAASSRHNWLGLRARQPIGSDLELTVTGRAYNEERGNGTPYQNNSSREKFASAALAGKSGSAFTWNGVAYVQDQSFASTFSGVNATRTTETPASNQFDVPAKAGGLAWTGSWVHGDGSRTNAGGDWRTVRGETKEYFTFSAGDFTRLRVAGGKQTIGGVFALHERVLAPGWRATLGGRVDWWKDTEGHRRESDRATGVASRNDVFADLDDTEFSPTAGLVYSTSRAWRIRANLQQSFRRPTLNELHRPFRVGPNLTEANAALRTEQNTSGELGAEWNFFANGAAANARPLLQVSATAFTNQLKDAVGNVTIARGPGTFPIVGFIAAGGVGRQRQNLDRIRVQGLELSSTWNVSSDLSLSADYIYNDATVRRASTAPALVGKRVAQVPRLNASFSAAWRGPAGLTFMPRVRWIGRQFEDDENQLILGEVSIIDVGVSRRMTSHLELFLNAENLANARIETGRTADGIVNVGAPRMLLGGLRGSW
jgi:outer membrane receptor protein involved in Fe transport